MSSIYSETEGEGLRYISSSVQQLLTRNKVMSYSELLLSINVKNKSTLKRRLYDVLSVMRALNLVKKQDKKYFMTAYTHIIEMRERIDEKKQKLNDLNEIKDALVYLVNRNSNIDTDVNIFRLPFLIVMAKKSSNIHCETDEERKFFRFKCTSKMVIMDDLKVLKLIHENKENSKPQSQIPKWKKNTDFLDFFI